MVDLLSVRMDNFHKTSSLVDLVDEDSILVSNCYGPINGDDLSFFNKMKEKYSAE